MLIVGLAFGVRGAQRLRLASVTGADERAAEGDGCRLLERLAVGGADAITPGDIAELPLGDRDRTLAALYTHLYGNAVVADARCAGCGQHFELRFSLDALVASRRPDGSAEGAPPRVKAGGAVLRLPTMRDLEAADAGDLIERLLVEGTVPPREEAEAVLEAADPALELDLSGICPECGAEQAVPFSMQGFFSAALKRDQAFLLREVHMIARGYGWSFDAILALQRAERQSFVRMLLAEGYVEPGLRRLVS